MKSTADWSIVPRTLEITELSMETSMMKIAVIGGGRWGCNHIKTFHSLGALAAVVDTDPATRREISQAYPNIKVHATIDPVLKDPSITGVSIATPAETHYRLAAVCLEANKHTLVEKPLSLFTSQARDLVRMADRQRLILMVGHLLLFHPAVRKIKELIDDGRLGRLQYIYSNRLNLGTVRKEENILWSFAP